MHYASEHVGTGIKPLNIYALWVNECLEEKSENPSTWNVNVNMRKLVYV